MFVTETPSSDWLTAERTSLSSNWKVLGSSFQHSLIKVVKQYHLNSPFNPSFYLCLYCLSFIDSLSEETKRAGTTSCLCPEWTSRERRLQSSNKYPRTYIHWLTWVTYPCALNMGWVEHAGGQTSGAPQNHGPERRQQSPKENVATLTLEKGWVDIETKSIGVYCS